MRLIVSATIELPEASHSEFDPDTQARIVAWIQKYAE
jgi:hypothetical protein